MHNLITRDDASASYQLGSIWSFKISFLHFRQFNLKWWCGRKAKWLSGVCWNCGSKVLIKLQQEESSYAGLLCNICISVLFFHSCPTRIQKGHKSWNHINSMFIIIINIFTNIVIIVRSMMGNRTREALLGSVERVITRLLSWLHHYHCCYRQLLPKP